MMFDVRAKKSPTPNLQAVEKRGSIECIAKWGSNAAHIREFCRNNQKIPAPLTRRRGGILPQRMAGG
jgi:hypothetical protein